MTYLVSIAGLLIVVALAFLMSNNRKMVKVKPILIMFVIQIALAGLLLNTQFGLVLIQTIAKVFNKLLEYSNKRVSFVFGGLANEGSSPFFLDVLLTIIFISVLIGIFHHLKIPRFLIKGIGFLLSKVNGLGKLESYNAIPSAMVGQSEVFITLKKQLGALPPHLLYTLCASAMSTVSMAMVGPYITMIEPKYVVTAIVINLFGGFVISSIIYPYIWGR